MRKEKIKILYAIPRLAKGGTEKHLLQLAEYIDKEKFDVTICCLFEPGDIVKDINSSNFNLICLNRKNIYDLRILFDLYRLIRKERYDIVHSYLFAFHYLALIPSKIAGIPVTLSSRRELATWKKLHHILLENIGNLFVDKVVACSEAAKRFALQNENLKSNKIATLYNGIDLNKFSPRKKDSETINKLGFQDTDKVIGMVSNLSSVKDHKTLLNAIVEIKKAYPEIKCVLVGDGYMRGDLVRHVDRLKLNENVCFLGSREDIYKILSIMDIFVLTSLMEGLPNAVLEAMACGLPVVATKVGGIPEIIENGRNGILLEPKDHQSLALALITLIEDFSLRKEMGVIGRKIIEQKFSLERMVNDYERLYTEILNS